MNSNRCAQSPVNRPAVIRYALARVCLLALLAGGAVAPAHSQTSACTIGVDNQSVLVNAAFDSVNPKSMPASVTTSPAFAAGCTVPATTTPWVYRWTLTLKGLSFSMVSGTTSGAVISSIQKSFSVASTTVEVGNGAPGHTAAAQAQVATTATLARLTSQLSTGQYQLRQDIDIKQEYCVWTGKALSCKNDGGARHFAAFYTLNVVTPPPPATTSTSGASTPPASTSSTPPASTASVDSSPTANTQTTPSATTTSQPAATTPGHGVTPNPLTVHGAMVKYRCEF